MRALSKAPFPSIDSSYVLELSEEQVKQKQYSTLDLCTFNSFTIVVDAPWAERWKVYVKETQNRLPVAVKASLRVELAILGVDFDLEAGQKSLQWTDLMRLKEGQATLVRQVQHILSCFQSTTADSSDLLQALQNHLAWTTS
jgi:hypothetical protein